MATTRESFLSFLTVGSVVHYSTEIDGVETRFDATVSKASKRGFTVTLSDFRAIALDAYGYVKGSTSRRIEAANLISADQWNTVASDRRSESIANLSARAHLRYEVGANAAF